MNEILPYEVVESFEFVGGPARIYRSEDGLLQVVLADEQAKVWDQLRHFHELDKKRFAPDAVPERAKNIWPEDIFPVVRQLPNPELITEVVLQNASLPGEIQPEIAGKRTAKVFPTGRVAINCLMDRRELDSTLLFAWARLLWFRYDVITHFFRYAAWLERQEFSGSTKGNLSDQENWAIHLVDMLGSGEQFDAVVQKAPLRAVLLASALQRALDETVGPKHSDLEKRINIVTENALPSVQKRLSDVLANLSSHPDDQDYAFKLLLLLGTEDQLGSLSITAANLANEPHTNSVLGKLGAIRSLEELNLSQTMLSRDGTGFLANLTRLSKLDLSDTKIMSSSLTPLRGLSALQELDLSGTQINESALATFGHLGSLKKLDIRDTALTGSKEALAQLLPDCQIITSP